jgi:N-acetylglucosaminyl-diphospho-decaprenol L-rhamnosyltransferase
VNYPRLLAFARVGADGLGGLSQYSQIVEGGGDAGGEGHLEDGMRGPTRALVDVVVVTHNSARHVRGAVNNFADDHQVHVVVVDNGSTDTTLDELEDLDVAVIAQPNYGFAHGCNVGWRSGNAPAVLFLNPDARISRRDLDFLLASLGDESVGIVGPRVVGDDGALAYSQRRFPRVLSTFAQAVYAQRLLPRHSWVDEVVRGEHHYSEPHDVEWLSGACLLVRRSLLSAIDGWDESYFLYSEDTQLCRSAWDAGARVRFEPRAHAVHVGGESTPRTQLLETLATSRILYARKNSSRLKAAAHRIGIGLEAATHTIVCNGGLEQRRGHLRALRAVLRPTPRRHIERPQVRAAA